MTQLSDKEHNAQMEDMRSFDEQMPCVGRVSNCFPNIDGEQLLRKLNTLPNTSAGFLQLNGILGKQGASFSWENLREDAYSDKYGI